MHQNVTFSVATTDEMHYYGSKDNWEVITMAMDNITAREMFVHVGLLDYGGFKKLSRSTKVNSRRFKSLYGCRPEVCAAIWFDLTHPSNRDDDPLLDPASFAPMHFLMGIRFLKLYETESVLLGAFKQEVESEKALREVVRKIVNVIQALKARKVRGEQLRQLLPQAGCWLSTHMFFSIHQLHSL
jgi:hypothetical protein